MGKGASLGEEAVLADSGRAGEVAAGVGRVRCLAFLSILLECSPVMPHVRIIEVLARQNIIPQPAGGRMGHVASGRTAEGLGSGTKWPHARTHRSA
jgi:hypothetical protein